MNFSGDYHTHTQYSHGKGNLRQNIIAARRKGLKEIGITDHGPRSYSYKPLGIKNLGVLEKIKREAGQIQSDFPDIRILVGVEANIINSAGDLDVPEQVLKKLDFVAVGFHSFIRPFSFSSFQKIVFDNIVTYRLLKNFRKKIKKRNTNTVIKAVKKHDIDFITHPGYQVDVNVFNLAKVCEREGTWLEINTNHCKLTEDFKKIAEDTKVNFIINSDAHNPDNVGELSSGLDIINKLKLDRDRIVNIQGNRKIRELIL